MGRMKKKLHNLEILSAILQQTSVTPSKEQGETNADEPQRLCMRLRGRKCIHTLYKDRTEIVEEYDEKTGQLLMRKTRKPKPTNMVRGSGDWIYEIGEER